MQVQLSLTSPSDELEEFSVDHIELVIAGISTLSLCQSGEFQIGEFTNEQLLFLCIV